MAGYNPPNAKLIGKKATLAQSSGGGQRNGRYNHSEHARVLVDALESESNVQRTSGRLVRNTRETRVGSNQSLLQRVDPSDNGILLDALELRTELVALDERRIHDCDAPAEEVVSHSLK